MGQVKSMSGEPGLTINGRHRVQTLTVNEASQLLNVHSNTLRRWSNLGIIRALRASPRGDRRFRLKDIARFIREPQANKANAKEVRYIVSPMLTVSEAAQLLNVHSDTLRRWSDLGIIRAYRVNPRGDRRFKRDDIIRFIHEPQANKGNEKEIKYIMSPMLTVSEAAQLLNVHSNTLRRWSNLGIIRAHRISPRGDRRFKRDDIIRFMYKLHAHNGNVKKVNVE
ncbi:MAG: helix-turn-helix domain-containing protein [Dehalococcoidales bacterium]